MIDRLALRQEFQFEDCQNATEMPRQIKMLNIAVNCNEILLAFHTLRNATLGYEQMFLFLLKPTVACTSKSYRDFEVIIYFPLRADGDRKSLNHGNAELFQDRYCICTVACLHPKGGSREQFRHPFVSETQTPRNA